MNRQDIEQQVLGIVATILRQPFTQAAEVTRQTVAGWDSLKHMEIMFAVEEELNVQFSENELGELDSVGKIADAVARQHAA